MKAGPRGQLAEQADAEIAELQDSWRRGEYQPGPSLAVQPDGTMTLRPSGQLVKVRKQGLAGLAVFALILVLRTISSGLTGIIVVAASVAALILALLGIYRFRLRHGAASLTAGQVMAPSWSGRRRAVARGMIQRAVLVSAELGSARSHVVPLVLLIGDGGRCLLHVSGTGIAPRDLKAFAAALQVPVGTRAQLLGPDELRGEYPGSVSWYWSHQVLVALLGSLLMILIVIGVVITLAVTGVLSQ